MDKHTRLLAHSQALNIFIRYLNTLQKNRRPICLTHRATVFSANYTTQCMSPQIKHNPVGLWLIVINGVHTQKGPNLQFTFNKLRSISRKKRTYGNREYKKKHISKLLQLWSAFHIKYELDHDLCYKEKYNDDIR